METSDTLDKEPTIMDREPDATMQPTSQDHQLMSKRRVLSFKPQPRLERRGQNGQRETEQPDHPASLEAIPSHHQPGQGFRYTQVRTLGVGVTISHGQSRV